MPVPYRIVVIAVAGLILSLVAVTKVTTYASASTQDTAVAVTIVVWAIAAAIIELRYRLREPNASRKEATH